MFSNLPYKMRYTDVIFSTKILKSCVARPPGADAFNTSSLRAWTLLRIVLPCSRSKMRSKLLATPVFVKTPPSILTPTLHSSAINLAFNLLSAKNGLQIIGTPFAILSYTELAPQCVICTPIELCPNT
ncbi:hypothetical protein NC653_023632 [Populus alba x Populus x berolinensis]|uniref:Uncharacterized protein n=1 Tax=Populus alba x Populus x berolinensis TaxID=444605 RepID=A0AAD6MI19_9ROSI|nr:hypothetical protein NC653_023632 [Populus alba x Populus x berolinensis]